MPDANGWNRIWYGGGTNWPLRPLSWLFGGLAAARRALYSAGVLSRHRVACPVVVVGNLTVGGTGKTPLVIWLARALHAQGIAVGIASRGYGSGVVAPRMVDASSATEQVGDEPVLMHRRTGVPVCVAARRTLAAQHLFDVGCRLVLCDDGLQHYALHRDCEIAVLDGARGLGNGQLLPAGPLREHAARLSSVDFVVVNDVPGSQIAVPPGALHMRLVGEQVLPLRPGPPARSLSTLRSQRVHAIAGIGNPARFFALLRNHGLDLIEHAFADHHPYIEQDICFDDALPVLMTEKDAVKCAAFGDVRHGYVPVEAHFGAADATLLVRHIAALSTGRKLSGER
ncbi:MAG: tetraacyldisaccharide 4'-kinase [Steroidobacteraceae bacterium]